MSLKLLVVDDEDMIRINLEAYLEDEGHEILLASTGEDAIELVKSNKDIDLAIVDVRLPGIDGSDLVSRMLDISPDTKHILHTGSSEYVLPQNLIDKGIKEEQIIFKPLIKMQTLLEMIDKLTK